LFNFNVFLKHAAYGYVICWLRSVCCSATVCWWRMTLQ